ncbi:hypothetical protein GOBAR_AA16426 [Gossypium barbadense]|uniref:Uncharacterized protein n=1 Tax=Gossypium barbadense TaxID=3634 RepID=A0A2P5XLK0_GOSBA|nr:hypothetical protein GOBAR_AA16426 [Gossypium barbadense]
MVLGEDSSALLPSPSLSGYPSYGAPPSPQSFSGYPSYGAPPPPPPPLELPFSNNWFAVFASMFVRDRNRENLELSLCKA